MTVRKKKKIRLSYEQRNALRGYGFILPWLIGFLVFYAGCLFQLGRFSVMDIKIDATTGTRIDTFVGFDNFITAFTAHASFKQVLTSSLMDMVIDLPLIIFFSLLVALLLNRKFRGRALVRAIFFLPIILSADAVGSAITRATELMNNGVSAQAAAQTSAARMLIVAFIRFLLFLCALF